MSPVTRLHSDPIDAMTDDVPNVVVVDPCFDAYTPLAESARAGKLVLHFRSEGSQALKLARRHPVDAWLIAAELDDMSGLDFVELLRAESCHEAPKVIAMVADQSGEPTHWEALEVGADFSVTKPISLEDLERILGMTPEQRTEVLSLHQVAGKFLTWPVSVGAAVVAVAVVMLG